MPGDSKAFRLVDFYLPRYKIYIEFQGLWNTSPAHKDEYKEKMKVYSQNKIPCVFFYPENLGIMNHTFEYRIRKELKTKKMSKELFRFNFDLFLKDTGNAFIYLLLSLICLIFGDYKANTNSNTPYILFFVIVSVIQIYRLISGYKRFFKLDYQLNQPINPKFS